MDSRTLAEHVSIPLVASNRMRIAGIQGVYGEPNGIVIVPVSLEEALREDAEEVILLDAGYTGALFANLAVFRERRPLARLIVIGVDHDDTFIECVLAAGAKGFLGANASAEEFRYAMSNVSEGSLWATRRVLSRLAESQVHRRLQLERRHAVNFTLRERQILALLLVGKGNREISEGLGIEAGTVKAHLGRIMRKAGVANRIELTMFMVKNRTSAPREARPMQGRLLH